MTQTFEGRDISRRQGRKVVLGLMDWKADHDGLVTYCKRSTQGRRGVSIEYITFPENATLMLFNHGQE